MAITAADLKIKLSVDGAGKAKRDLADVSGAFDTTAKRSRSMFQTIVGTAGGFLTAQLFTSMARGARDAASAFVWGASDLEEAQSKVNTVFGESSSVVSAWSDAAANSFGMTKTQALDAAGTFGNLFTAMGFTGDAASQMSTDFIGLAADLGSFNNVPTPEALAAIQSGLIGEYEPLRRFGVLLTAAEVESYALANGIWNGTDAMTEQQKVLARQGLIYEQTAVAQGDFARTSDGLANQSRILRANLGNLVATMGKGLLPAANKLTTWGVQAVAMFGRIAKSSRPFETALAELRTLLYRAFGGPASRAIMDFVYDLVDGFRDFADVARTVAVFVGGMLGSAFQFLGRHLSVVSGGVQAVAALFAGFMAWGAAVAIVTGLGAALAVLLSPIALLIAGAAALGIAWETNFLGIREGVEYLITAFGDAGLRGVLFSLPLVFRSIRDEVSALIGGALTLATTLVDWTLDVAVPTVTGWIVSAASNAWDALKTAAGWAWDGIASLGSWTVDTAIPAVSGWIADAASSVWDALKAAAGWTGAVLGDLGSWTINTAAPSVTGWVRAASTNVWNAIKGAVGWAGDVAGDLGSWVLNTAAPTVTGWIKWAAFGTWNALKNAAGWTAGIVAVLGSWTLEVAEPVVSLLGDLGAAINTKVDEAYDAYVAAGAAPQLGPIRVEANDFDVVVNEANLAAAMPKEPSRLQVISDTGFRYGFVTAQTFVDGIDAALQMTGALFREGPGSSNAGWVGDIFTVPAGIAVFAARFVDGVLSSASNATRSLPQRFVSDVLQPMASRMSEGFLNLFGADAPLWKLDDVINIDIPQPSVNWTSAFETLQAGLDVLTAWWDSLAQGGWSLSPLELDIGLPNIPWPSTDDLLSLVPQDLKDFLSDPWGWLTRQVGGDVDNSPGGVPGSAPASGTGGGGGGNGFELEMGAATGLIRSIEPVLVAMRGVIDTSKLMRDGLVSDFGALKLSAETNIPPIGTLFSSAPAAWASPSQAALAGIRNAFAADLPAAQAISATSFEGIRSVVISQSDAARAGALRATLAMRIGMAANFTGVQSDTLAKLRATSSGGMSEMDKMRLGISLSMAGIVSTMRGRATEASNAVRSAFSSGMAMASLTIRNAAAGFPNQIAGIAGRMYGAGQDAMTGLVAGVRSRLGALQAAVNAALSIMARIPAMGRSPWPMMIDAGADAMDGLVVGMLRRQDRLERVIGDTLSLFEAAPRMTVPGSLAVAGAPSRTAGDGLTINGGLHIHQQPGEEGDALASRVVAELRAGFAQARGPR